MPHDDLRTDRDRLASLADQLDRSLEGQSDGSVALVVVTFQETSYPSTARALYACTIQQVSGQEVEGAVGTLTPTHATIYAYNFGSAVPPSGTAIIALQAGDRWVFRYDG
jgi:hypothetical protein